MTTTREDATSTITSSGQQSIEGLVENGAFNPVHRGQIVEHARIYGLRFIDALRQVGQRNRKNSPLVEHNYSEKDATSFATGAPTVQRFSQRLSASLTKWMTEMTEITCDGAQVYFQAATHLERNIYRRAPEKVNIPRDTVFLVLNPWYGIPESGLHWYLRFLDHHVGKVGMEGTQMDPCVLVKRHGTKVKEILLFPGDYSLML